MGAWGPSCAEVKGGSVGKQGEDGRVEEASLASLGHDICHCYCKIYLLYTDMV